MTIIHLALTIIAIVISVFGIFVVIPYVGEEQTPVCNNLSEVIHSDVPIYSTEDGSAVTGSFFLGFGRVDTHPAYYFYTGDDTNGFQRQMLNTETVNVKIFRDSENPHMIKKMKYVMEGQVPVGSICVPVNIVELHVPRNTLIKDTV